jgi:cytosol alanyl aminopeptidase
MTAKNSVDNDRGLALLEREDGVRPFFPHSGLRPEEQEDPRLSVGESQHLESTKAALCDTLSPRERERVRGNGPTTFPAPDEFCNRFVTPVIVGRLLAIQFLLALAFAAHAASDASPVPKLRLGHEARPLAYAAELRVLPDQDTFSGEVTIDLELARRASFLWLHGRGLTVSNAYLEQTGRRLSAKSITGGEEFLGFAFDQPAQAGKAQLHVAYGGTVSDKDCSGLFRRQQGGRWYAATQFEATWARRVFPCFDEPAFKVPWRIALHVRSNDVALANAPMLSETLEDGGMKCVRFAVTRPLPSYLVAIAVGPFDVCELGKIGRNNIPVRIFMPHGRTNEAAFAAQAIPALLRRLEDYYLIPFPYEKLDHVAVPQFDGAMENAGLILYSETMLLSPPGRQTSDFKRECADTCAHEMSHQWFGDLVTMAWWDDLWLNEAFATWITPKIVNAWKPEWQLDLDRVLAAGAAVLSDSLVNTRSIRQAIQAEEDIDNAFDDITYDKGAAVLTMFESWTSPETFRKAIRDYLESHAWKNATTADFLKSLDGAAGQSIAPAVSTFLDQPGVPLVSVEVQGASGRSPSLRLSQRRYLPVGSAGETNRHWRIPIELRYGNGGSDAHLRRLLVNPQERVSLGGDSAGLQWLLVNQQAAGYYVVAYHGDLLHRLLEQGAGKLSPAERISVAQSLTASVRSADVPLGEALALQPILLRDPERRVVTQGTDFIGGLRDLVPDALKPNYRAYIRNTIGPLVTNASWEPTVNETDDQRLQRLAYLDLLARDGESNWLIAEAKRLALAWLDDRAALSPDAVDYVLGVAAHFADAPLFDRLLREAERAGDPSDRHQLVSALGACADPALARRALQALVAHEFRPLDSLSLLSALSIHAETRALTYDFVKQNYEAVAAALPHEVVFWYLPMIAQGFAELERRDDVQAFFQGKDVKLTGGPRILAQVVESVALNHAFKAAQQPSLIEFLKHQ